MVKIGSGNNAQFKRLQKVSPDKLPSLNAETPDVVVKDLFALGPRLSPAALNAVRQVARGRFEVANLPTTFDDVGPALERDLARSGGALGATLILEQHARQLTKLAPDSATLELGATQLLEIAVKSPVKGDDARPLGDPWATREWPLEGSALHRLATLLEARGLRPRELPLLRTNTTAGWWSSLPALAPLFRNADANVDVDVALQQVGAHAPIGALVDVDELEAILSA